MRQGSPLTGGWRIKELAGDTVDVAALTREAAAPGAAWLPARMPAQVHDILLEHGRISDPHVGRNAADSAWVGEKDWAYACTFASPDGIKGPAFLCFGGLDTLASAYLNGEPIGRFSNMNREYAVDVRDQIAPPGRTNVLLIVFSSPLRFVQQIVQPPERSKGIAKHKHLRKCTSDFSSYLGARPHSVKVGVFRDIVLDLPDRSWIEDLCVRTELAPDHSCAVIRAGVAAAGAPASLYYLLADPDGREVARGPVDGLDVEIAVPAPKLWWPWTHGTPHLYQLRLSLVVEGEEVDSRTEAVGIREIRPILADPKAGENRFQFVINGQPIFLRGANWAPAEGVTHCWPHERAMRLLDLAQHGRMNVLRVWGEGHLPPREFYDECDRRGILVWQDFMFGYGMHPSGDPGFDSNCRAEIEDTLRRLRNHSCILLWCGGNENHMGWDFAFGAPPALGSELFEQIMPEASARLDPSRLFHPSSPYGGRAPNWPLEGDWHDYTTLTFSPEASVPLFASEVGRASAPSLASMRRFLSEEELWPAGHDPAICSPGRPAWPPMWQYRSVDGSWDKVGPIEEFCDPTCADDLIRVLGTAHGEYLQRRVERERRGVPDGQPDGQRRCWGNIVWRLNDAWPILYWSVIDYYLEPKIAFYFLRRAYDPVLVCFEKTADRIAAWVVNDSPDPVAGELIVRRRRFDGACRGELRAEAELAPGQSRRCLDLADLGPISLRDEFLHAMFGDREATLLLTGERYLHLPRAGLTVSCSGREVEIATDLFARQVCLEVAGTTGAVSEDNFFDLPPGRTRTVRVLNSAGGEAVTVRALNAPAASVRIHSGS